MKPDEYNSPVFIDSSRHSHNAPYSSSLATLASTSSSSVWSDASSQHSDDTSLTVPCSASSSDLSDASYSLSRPHLPSLLPSTACDSAKLANNPCAARPPLPPPAAPEVPAELRQNPRRTSSSSTSRSGCPPPLVRQSDRKVNFVDNLVDSSTQIVEAVWPTSSVPCRNENGSNGVLPLRTFIQETLRRSRTSYSTLQVALYYLVLIKSHVPRRDFTMEQPDDCYATRALQCGRRMFLAALILASKYLQDRNYSARAWSKISGLATHEINQNEMAFVSAVDWKLHITDEVYNRWTDCVMKYTPTQPPSPGGAASCASSAQQQRLFDRQCEEFKAVILRLTPELDNLDDIAPWSCKDASRPLLRRHPSVAATTPPKSLYTPALERSPAATCSYGDVNPPKLYGKPAVMEPSPASVYTPGRQAPALGLLPTPRLTPQTTGFCTPAASAASYLLGKPFASSSMSFAMAQASTTSAAQCLDRWPASAAVPIPIPSAAPSSVSGASASSPHSYMAGFPSARRSSLANTVSTASSPESMVSDSSRTSRSSSISSASSLASAPSTKLDVQARCRYAKLYGERMAGLRPSIASVPEDYEVAAMSSSPESYAAKDFSLANLDTPLARREREMEEAARDPANDAARALQELQNYRCGVAAAAAAAAVPPTSAPTLAKSGSKRSRTVSMDGVALQENVREMLAGRRPGGEAAWSDTLVRLRPGSEQQVPVRSSAALQGGRKRVCCSAEAAQRFHMSSLHPSMGGFGGPGMWEGILN